MTSFPPDADIRRFWRWVQTIAGELAQDLENGEILEALDQEVTRLGDISWEVGPGRRAENALTLTPDGDPDALAVTKRIIAFAPPVPGWEFHHAKPPKDWNLVFSLETADGSILDVDASTWRYVLFRFPDNTFDLVLAQEGLASVAEDDRYAAAVIVIDGQIGEEARMSLIDTIEPAEALLRSGRAPGNFNPRSGSASHVALGTENVTGGLSWQTSVSHHAKDSSRHAMD